MGNTKSSHDGSPSIRGESSSETGTSKHADQMASKDSTLSETPKSSKMARRGKKHILLTNPSKGKQRRKTMLQKPATNKVLLGETSRLKFYLICNFIKSLSKVKEMRINALLMRRLNVQRRLRVSRNCDFDWDI